MPREEIGEILSRLLTLNAEQSELIARLHAIEEEAQEPTLKLKPTPAKIGKAVTPAIKNRKAPGTYTKAGDMPNFETRFETYIWTPYPNKSVNNKQVSKEACAKLSPADWNTVIVSIKPWHESWKAKVDKGEGRFIHRLHNWISKEYWRTAPDENAGMPPGGSSLAQDEPQAPPTRYYTPRQETPQVGQNSEVVKNARSLLDFMGEPEDDTLSSFYDDEE